MADLRDTVYVNVEHFDDEDSAYYVASCDDLVFTTEGETFEELLANIQECLDLNLKYGDPVAEFNVVPNPRVKIVMELPQNYAETA
jgi:predicted RNase H-like HicB family nuclease